MSIPSVSSTPAHSAPRHKNDPHNFPRNSHVSLRRESEFCDTTHWDELARQHLGRYNLPAWSVPCDTDAMRRWLDRLDLNERDHLRVTATSLDDFIAMNPAWPLRAWIGLMLEIRDGQQ